MTYDFNTSLLSGDAIWPPRAKLSLSELTEAETSSPVRYIPGRLRATVIRCIDRLSSKCGAAPIIIIERVNVRRI